MQILFQPESGLLAPSRCVRAQMRLAKGYGAVVRENTEVTRITPHADSVTIETQTGERLSAARLIITAGGWSKRLLSTIGLDLPLTVMRCQEAHFFPQADTELYDSAHMPVFIAHTRAYGDYSLYGLPSHEGSGVKTAFHGGERFEHPSQIDYSPDEAHVEHIRTFTRRHLPAVGAGALGLTRICLYTMTPDDHFIVDLHPEYRHIAIGSPCSGHGFKFSTGIGKILGDLVITSSTDQDIALFTLARFLPGK
jgi:monomeric sarcosine oxidase